MNYRSTLPQEKNKQYFDFYTKCMKDMYNLKEAMQSLISDVEEPSELEGDARYSYYKMVNEMNELEARINVVQDMITTYETRMGERQVVIEEEAKVVNENWLTVWNKAKAIAEKDPMGFFGLAVNNYPDDASQELKNETYKALVKQIELVSKK